MCFAAAPSGCWTSGTVDIRPVLPAYGGPNVRGVIPALLAPRGAPRPAWIPSLAADARQVMVLVVDGLGWEQLRSHVEHAPTLAAMEGGPITTVAPSTTATALTSITTGLTPGEHGVVGYRIDVGGEVMNTLRWWTTRDARKPHPPAQIQPFPPFLGEDVPVISKAELEGSGFTEAHLRGTRPLGWRAPSSIAVIAGELLAKGEPFVYAYYDGVDKIAHERGFGPYYEAELRAADGLVAEIVNHLPRGAALLVTADHGQVQVGDDTRPLDPSVLALVRGQSGEGRFRWLHARPGGTAELAAAAREAHGSVAWIVTREQVIDEGWLGPVVSPPVAARLGDVALVAHAPTSFEDPMDSGPFPLVCRHGSLTSAEMLVPLLAAVND